MRKNKPKYTYPIGVKIPGTRLTPLKLSQNKKSLNYTYICDCECGEKFETPISQIVYGRTKSCGCQRIDSNRKRGFSDEQFSKKFYEKVSIGKPDECHLWNGHRSEDGYGVVVFRRKIMGAHRAIWTLKKGEIPKGKSVLHRCDTPACVNVDHLWIGTQAENVQDCANKGRIRTGDRRGEKCPTATVTDAQALEIRRSYATGNYLQKDLARLYKVNRHVICEIVNRKTWTHV